MKPFAQTWLSLGSNLGDRLENLLAGTAFLLSHGLEWKNGSGVYETEPVGYTAQPAFLNMVIHAKTRLSPLALLEVCQQAEKALLRQRTIRWGPRTLDVDILLIDDLILHLSALTLPHPRMAERAFVLGPLGEMDPGLMTKWTLPHLTEGIRLQMPASDFRDRLSRIIGEDGAV